jgi:hypothetical protein
VLQLRLVLAAGVAWAACGCGHPLSADECNELLDHYTERLVRAQSPALSDDEVARAERDARAKAAADPAFAQCSTKVSRRQWECAMKAPSPDAIEQCLL